MNQHYLVLADRAHLRIFAQRSAPGQSTPGFAEVRAMDFPAGHRSYSADDTDMAGRFQSSRHPARGAGAPDARTGMSIDERLPMQQESRRRIAAEIAEAIDTFLASHPNATWDFAAPPSLHDSVREQLSPAILARLGKSLPKDLVHQPLTELLDHLHTPAQV